MTPRYRLPAQLPATLKTPKQSDHSREFAYRFYAGFSPDFVGSILSAVAPEGTWHVGDVWSGSGTTVRVASEYGHAATGLDINPAMVIVGTARLLLKDQVSTFRDLFGDLVACPKLRVANDDPLTDWLIPGTAALVRGLVVELQQRTGTDPSRGLLSMPAPAAACYVTLFLAMRALAGRYVGSNPTWVRRPSPNERLRTSWPRLRAVLLQSADVIAASASGSAVLGEVRLADTSSEIRVNRPFDVVVTSPPYCTRIDYVAATRFELSVLGMGVAAQDLLRRSTTGTTTVPHANPAIPQTSVTALDCLTRVASHVSKASATYYAKWLAQYLAAYGESLRLLTTAMNPNGAIAMVVQDSYYKEIRIDLHAITLEYLSSHGWTLRRAYNFPIPVTKAAINAGTRRYRASFGATETVGIYSKAVTE